MNQLFHPLIRAFHQFYEAAEVVLGVVGAGRSLRVILNRKDWKTLVLHTFDAVVVEVYVRDLYVGRKAIGANGKAVVV
jgi:hypothetical protein